MTAVARYIDNASTTPIADEVARPRRIPLPSVPALGGTRPIWAEAVEARIRELQELAINWDGYGAGPIRRDVMAFLRDVLEAIMRPNTPAPHITPMSHEGVLIEWHQNGVELELEIEKPGGLWMSFADEIERMEFDEPLTGDLRKLSLPIDKLTKRAVVKGG